MEQELCLQLEMERSWSSLVHTMVANCSQIDSSLAQLQEVVRQAVDAVVGHPCRETQAINLPPTLETSLDSIVDRIDRTGLARPNPALPFQRRR